MSMILAGDIGGTNTRLLAATCTAEGYTVLAQKNYASHTCTGLDECLHDFLAHVDNKAVAAACLAVAGPVHVQHVKVTNLPWEFSAQELAANYGIARVRLLNDFEAVGYGIPHLPAADLHTLQTGTPTDSGLACVIGAGTGLGQATLQLSDTGVTVWPGEGGHCDFAPRNPMQYDLARYWAEKLGRVSNETFVSGPGIARLFEFLQQHTGTAVSPALQDALYAGDPAAAISRFALEHNDPLAVQALELFSELYGSVAGNFSLAVKPAAGMYIAGGIAPRIIEFLKQPRFLAAFTDKPPMTALLQSFPVHVVLNPQVGLFGALHQACLLAKEN